MNHALVPPERWDRWVENFASSHGETRWSVIDDSLVGVGADGSEVTARLPFGRKVTGSDPADLIGASAPPDVWGVLLVRKGGFAVARLEGEEMVESKVGQRHVQSRTKKGGSSSGRFARRRGNQARVAYEAAAEHARRILRSGIVTVTGGDRTAVDAVLDDLAETGTTLTVVARRVDAGDPRRAVLERAIRDARSIELRVNNVRQDTE